MSSLSDAQLYDYMYNFVGLFLFTLPGLQTPAPFGGAIRQVMLNLDPDRLYARGLSPRDVLNTMQSSNFIYPGGTVKLGNYEYAVLVSGSPRKADEFNQFPIKYQNNATVFVSDVAKASDSHNVQTDIARVNGRPGNLQIHSKTLVRLNADCGQRGQGCYTPHPGSRAQRNPSLPRT